MNIFEKMGEAFGIGGKEKMSTQEFIEQTQRQIEQLKMERKRVQENIDQGVFIENNTKRLEKIDREIQGLGDKIAFAEERERMGIQ